MPDLQQHAEDLDALTAAPQNHTLLFENETVRVLDTLVRPGQIVPLHTHQWPSTNYLLSWSDFIRRDGDRAVLLDSRSLSPKPAIGSAFRGAPPGPAHPGKHRRIRPSRHHRRAQTRLIVTSRSENLRCSWIAMRYRQDCGIEVGETRVFRERRVPALSG